MEIEGISRHTIFSAISYIIPFVEFVFLLALILYACRKKQPMLPDGVKYKQLPFRLIAVGMVLAFAPLGIGIVDNLLGYDLYWFHAPFFVFGLQGFGAFLMVVGFGYAYKEFEKTEVKTKGFTMGAIGSVIGLVANLRAAYIHRSGGESVIPDTVLFFISTLALVCAFVLLAKQFTRFRRLAIVTSMLLMLLFLSFAHWSLEARSGCSVNMDVVLFTDPVVTLLYTPLLFAMTVLGAGVAGAQLRVVQAKKGEETEDKSVEAATEQVGESAETDTPAIHTETKAPAVSKAPQVQADTQAPKVQREAAVSSVSADADNDILEKLKGYDDERLRRIVDNPRFHSQAVVERARQLIARRSAWEAIKDLTDEQLFDMTVADKGLYDNDIVEAASMELYQRESPLLRSQFMALTPDTLSAIASGTTPAPEGIRLAAQSYLSKTTRP